MTAAYPVLPSDPGLVRCVRVFAGELGQVARVRAFVAYALAGCPARETLLACASELAANAIAHTASGAGGVFTVEVAWPAAGMATVAVTDAGAPCEPAIRQSREIGEPHYLAESGRGLALVDALSSSWGYRDLDTGPGRTVWAAAAWPVAVSVICELGAGTCPVSPRRARYPLPGPPLPAPPARQARRHARARRIGCGTRCPAASAEAMHSDGHGECSSDRHRAAGTLPSCHRGPVRPSCACRCRDGGAMPPAGRLICRDKTQFG